MANSCALSAAERASFSSSSATCVIKTHWESEPDRYLVLSKVLTFWHQDPNVGQLRLHPEELANCHGLSKNAAKETHRT
jgi:hypothetical protein